MKTGRKPLRDLSVAIGERFPATRKEQRFLRQCKYRYSNRINGKFEIEREYGKVYFKRVA